MNLFGIFGGEEFILFLPETNLKLALLCVDRIRKIVEKIDFPKVGHPVIVSIGVGQYQSEEELVHIVDGGINLCTGQSITAETEWG
nr:hypothetical protein [uncultured Ilyobacter sp.]